MKYLISHYDTFYFRRKLNYKNICISLKTKNKLEAKFILATINAKLDALRLKMDIIEEVEYIKELLKEYDIKKIIYVNSPGSFMSIKVAYIFLKTISITKNITFNACEGFEFNQNSPIKALGKKYFIKSENELKVDFLEKDCIIHDFNLPMSIEKYNFNEETLPIYNLPAV